MAGGVAALVLGGGAAALLLNRGGGSAGPSPASVAGLEVETPGVRPERIDPQTPLRCFVDGRLAGTFPLSECARRNGVATGALDVGLDSSGVLAGQTGIDGARPLTPPSAVPAARPADEAVSAPVTDSAAAGSAPCWRFAGDWRRLGDQTLAACVQTLFGGECERQGGAAYGRWADHTLRRAPGRIEISADNHSFRLLADQAPGVCGIGPLASPPAR